MKISKDYFRNVVDRKGDDSPEIFSLSERIKARFMKECPWFWMEGIEDCDTVFRFIAREVLTNESWSRFSTGESESFTDYRRKNLMLSGMCGCGKTTMALFIAAKVENADFFTAEEIDFSFSTMPIAEFRDEFSPLIAKSHPDLLVLDDIGGEHNRRRYGDDSFTSGIFERCYSQWTTAGSTCVITTNLTPDAIRRQYGERAMSRVYEMFDFVAFNSRDYRMSPVTVVKQPETAQNPENVPARV